MTHKGASVDTSKAVFTIHAIDASGRGARRDTVFVERLWRSVKYEEVYLRAYATVAEARGSIGRYLTFCNGKRPHSSLDARTPDRAYFDNLPLAAEACKWLLVAIINWASRRVLPSRVSNTMERDTRIEAREEALQQYGPPIIFNTDQESQSPALALPGFWRRLASGSAWMAAAAGWTTCSLNGSGGRRNMNAFISMPFRRAAHLPMAR